MPMSYTRRSMGTYHTLFIATDADLDRLFPGWVPVQPEGSFQEVVNPFTRQRQQVYKWTPMSPPRELGSPSLHDDVWGKPVSPIVSPDGEYLEMLEQSTAPGLRVLPHFRGKNLDPFCVIGHVLLSALGDDAARPLPPARVGVEQAVDRIPRSVSKRLVALDEAAIDDVALRLLEEGGGDPDALDEFVEYGMKPLVLLCKEALRLEGDVCHHWDLSH